MNKIATLAALVLLAFSGLHGQYAETIRTGRPGQSIGPFTVGPRVFQVQSGFTAAGSENDFGEVASGGFETVIRYGLLERFEVSGLFNYSSSRISPGSQEVSGVDALHLGFRYNLCEGNGLVPSIGIQYRLRTKAVGDPFRAPATGSVVTLVTQQTLGKKLSLITNNGLSWDGWSAYSRWFYVVNLSFALTDKWGVFMENYGDSFRGNFDTYLDGGLSFLASPNLQLDLFGGGGVNDGTSSYFLSMGVSWRIRHGRLFN